MSLKKLAQELNVSISSPPKALRDSHEISHLTKLEILSYSNGDNPSARLKSPIALSGKCLLILAKK